jgi:hypothetical protein
MTSVMPEGEAIRKAVQWISEKLKEDSDQSISKLIEQANVRFNLSPKDAEYLSNFYGSGKKIPE